MSIDTLDRAERHLRPFMYFASVVAFLLSMLVRDGLVPREVVFVPMFVIAAWFIATIALIVACFRGAERQHKAG